MLYSYHDEIVQVPGIKEDTYIQIPPGTASHTKMRLTGKGIKKLNYAGHGDQYINIKVKVPKLLTEKQKALIQAWAELETDTPGTIQGISSTVEGRLSLCDVFLLDNCILLFYSTLKGKKLEMGRQ
ncbi:unnamed protein product [Onchocerca flexuosa]|uniref:DnaJ_C domain-containing protein n=1 Tax=Onchocerca flexuosa TaxID=387005 RepID=A0A183HU74_9BILA|nr:unnamed protein product [Onchocerca flexuosa]